MIGIITGSGFPDLPDLTERKVERVETPYGPPVGLTLGLWDGHEVCFVPRHGSGHSVPPHGIDYRGTMAALAHVGVDAVLATAAVGSIEPSWPSGTLALITDYIDLTSGRADTFFDGVTPPMACLVSDHGRDEIGAGVVHTDMSEPYDPQLRSALAAGAERAGVAVQPSAVYCCTNGPRFETKAEIEMMSRIGGQVVGMTGYPEVALAVEAGLPYASMALVSNPAAGVIADGAVVSVEDVIDVLGAMAADVRSVLAATLNVLSEVQ